MVLQLIAIWLLTLPVPVPGRWNPQALDWDKAAGDIRRLPPSAFPELPAAIREELDRKGCTIPQAHGEHKPHNVVQGSVTGKGLTDWAVLCSHGGESVILVFHDGSNKFVSQLARGADRDGLQVVEEGKIGYSRKIFLISGESILRYQKESAGPTPPPIDHQGIEDSFVGKSSVIWYYFGGQWLKLTGAD